MTGATLEQARAAKARAKEVFGPLAVVVGAGITNVDGGYAVRVNLGELPAPEVELPTAIGEVPVQVKVVGRIRKQ